MIVCFFKSIYSLQSNKEIKVYKKFAEEKTHFGSIYDWIPIYKGLDGLILICANPDNSYFKRFCLCCRDDHERCGWYTCSEKETIESLLNESIVSLMIDRNMPTYYG